MLIEFVSIEIYDDELTTVEINETGSQGVSAYGIAVANGFVGTEADWLESLNGPSLITTSTATTLNGPLVGDAGTVRQGIAGVDYVGVDDTRLSNARVPLPHTHGNISNAGAIGVTANLPLITTTGGAVTTGTFGTAANTFCVGNDARLSDARTPLLHNQAWNTITSTPTTLMGYGITDGVATSDARLSDAREWTAQTISQAEAEAGTETIRRAVTAQRMRQAVIAVLVEFEIATLPEQFDSADWDV